MDARALTSFASVRYFAANPGRDTGTMCAAPSTGAVMVGDTATVGASAMVGATLGARLGGMLIVSPVLEPVVRRVSDRKGECRRTGGAANNHAADRSQRNGGCQHQLA